MINKLNGAHLKCFFILCVVFILQFCCLGCQNNESAIDDNYGIKNLACLEKDGIGVVELTEYVQKQKNKESYELFKSLSSVEIKKLNIEENVIYLAALTSSIGWETELFRVILDDSGEISAIVSTGIGGNKYLFDYELVKLNDVSYIAVYSASHSGNGDLQFFPISESGIGEMAFSLPYVLDDYYEESEDLAIQYSLSSEYGSGVKCSLIYPQKRLNVEYLDLHKNGETQIVLNGLQQLIVTKNGVSFVAKWFYINRIYEYDKKTECFVETYNIKQEIVFDKE